MIALPLVWFISPLITTLKAVVRSPTALTRRKTVVIKMQMPREAFFELVSTMKESDAEGLLRDAETGDPLPTNRGTAHATVNRWKYSVEKGSALDRLLRFQDYDPAPAEMATATEADGAWEVEALEDRRVRNGKVEYLVVWAGEGWEGWPPESKRTWETEGRIHADLVAAYDQAAPALPPQVKRRKRKRAPALHARGHGAGRARLSVAAQRRGGVPQHISMACSPFHVEFVEAKDRSTMPRLTVTMHVLTMDKMGHIIFPTVYSDRRRAQLRLQARELLRQMIADPNNPTDNTMTPALTGTGTFSVTQSEAATLHVAAQA